MLPTDQKMSLRIVIAAGLFLVGASVVMCLLSKQFVWGEGHEHRPIIAYVSWYLTAWVAFLLAFRFVKGLKSQKLGIYVLVIAAVCRLLQLPTNPVQESDFYRYLWDGHVTISGQNPWAVAPADMHPATLPSASSDLDSARKVHARINYPEVPTIYPLGAQAAFATTAWCFGWNIYGFRVLLLLADLSLMLIAWRLIRARGGALPELLAYAWCPLVFKEFLNGMHIDLLAALFLGLMVLALTYRRYPMALAALLGAGLIKLTPLGLLPLILIAWWRQSRRQAIIGGCVASLVLALSVGVMFIGADRPHDGLMQFSSEWATNGAIYPRLKQLILVVHDSDESASAIAKGTLAICWLILLGYGCYRVSDERSAIHWSGWLLLAMWLLAPLGNPWYLGWLLPFIVCWHFTPAVVVMVATSLYYLDFHIMYHDLDYQAYDVLWATQYLPIFAFLSWHIWQLRKNESGDIASRQADT